MRSADYWHILQAMVRRRRPLTVEYLARLHQRTIHDLVLPARGTRYRAGLDPSSAWSEEQVAWFLRRINDHGREHGYRATILGQHRGTTASLLLEITYDQDAARQR